MSRQDIVKKASLSEGIPEGYEWCNPNYSYKEFVRHGWTLSQMITWGHLVLIDKESKSNINQQEESKMSNVTRRVVNIQLVDEDAGLPVEHSLVGKFEDVVTEDSDQVTIQELISTGEVAELLKVHNSKRVELDNIEIQNRTGNTVKLRPVKLKDLSWKIK